jgi:hypothetical protein
MHAWLSDSLRRFYPRSPAQDARSLVLDAARGERVSFQMACRTDDTDASIIARVDAPDGLDVTVRRVGYVPVAHANTETAPEEIDGIDQLPGFVPDPLLLDAIIDAGPYETNAFWITVRVPADIRPGAYPVSATVTARGEPTLSMTATIIVHQAIVPPRRDFPVTHWFYVDTLCDWYKIQPFDQTFWRLLDRYLSNMAAHGQDTVYVPLFTPPLDGRRRPGQLLGVHQADGQYQFDWSLVRRWISAARARGISWFEWTHLCTQWGAQHAILVYEGHGEGSAWLWPPETAATASVYRDFLAQFLPAFERFLRAEGLMDRSFFHLSDEPHGDEHRASYRAARGMLRGLAPWMPVMDALSDVRFAQEGLVDTPVALISAAPDFVRAGFPAWAYFCCQPRGHYLNRLLDTPLAKIRMSGWIFYRTRVRGFLHWGYNYWYRSQTTELIDPYAIADGHRWPDWAFGDPFVVYPGIDGPIDSLRWEVFAESMQDYALLQATLTPDAPELGAIRDYADFPRDAAWITSRRRSLLTMLDERS